MIAKKSIGQNTSFICSHVDSLTLENGATHIDLSSQSYKKCKKVPIKEDKAKPINCHSLKFLFISPPQIKYLRKIYSKMRFNIHKGNENR